MDYKEFYNIGHENQTGLVVNLNEFLMVDKKALESLCRQVLEATCADGAEYGYRLNGLKILLMFT